MQGQAESCGKGSTPLTGTGGYECIGQYIIQKWREKDSNRIILAPYTDAGVDGERNKYHACADCPARRPSPPTETTEATE